MAHDEVELRLTVSPADLPRLRRLALLTESSAGRSTTRKLGSTYFDTPSRALRDAGVTLRVRNIGKRRLQTLKLGRSFHAGISRRAEHESWIDGDTPDLTALKDKQVAELLAKTRADGHLRPVFATTVRRTERLLHYVAPDGSRADIVVDIDVGEIRAGDSVTPVHEVELELRAGPPGALYDLALALSQLLPVRIGVLSKAARAERLAQPVAVRPVKAARTSVRPGMTAGDAMAAVIGDCLEQVAANEAAVLSTDDPEGPHQMRVGLRRLRVALSLAQRLLPAGAVAGVVDDVRWLSAQLAEAREWDVFVTEILRPRAGRAGKADSGLAALDALAAERQATGYRMAREAVLSPRFTRLHLAVGRLQETVRAVGGKAVPFAAKCLDRRDARIRDLGVQALAGSDDARHDLRIEFKKLRYTSEFSAELFDQGRIKKLLGSAASMQELLGRANDLVVAVRQVQLLEAAAGEADRPAVRRAAARIVPTEDRPAAEVEADIEASWRHFADQRRFWPKPAR